MMLPFLLSTPFYAHAEVYMTEIESVKAIFGSDQGFTKKSLSLTKDDVDAIEKLSDQTVRSSIITAYVNAKKDVVVIEQVLGKHEYITYATGITHDGRVKGIEILEYRESYGSQVKNESWRKQFVGKTIQDPLKVEKDITNISGATLSSTHVTAGVKRLLQTYERIHSQL